MSDKRKNNIELASLAKRVKTNDDTISRQMTSTGFTDRFLEMSKEEIDERLIMIARNYYDPKLKYN